MEPLQEFKTELIIGHTYRFEWCARARVAELLRATSNFFSHTDSATMDLLMLKKSSVIKVLPLKHCQHGVKIMYGTAGGIFYK